MIDSDVIKEQAPRSIYSDPWYRWCDGTCAEALGAEVYQPEEQVVMDSRFPTVQSPNPENAEDP